jgi:hypothetical protein
VTWFKGIEADDRRAATRQVGGGGAPHAAEPENDDIRARY